MVEAYWTDVEPDFTLYCGDNRVVIPQLDAVSVDAIVTDPPYELGFMGKGWDRSGIAYDVDVWRECLRVLKPGGHLLAFGGSRTYHRLACAIEDAGFEIRDQIQWLYGCLSDDIEILINGRWEPYHKAVKDSLALCYNMDHDTFEWQPVQELFVYQYSDTAYRIQSDSTDQIVSRNHRCIVERSGAYTFRVAEEVAREQQARIPVLENVSAVLDALPWDSFSGRKDMRLRLPRSVEAIASGLAGAPESYCEQGTRWMDRGVARVLQGEDDRRQESGLERRGDLLSEAWELQADQVRAMPARVFTDGPQRWLRDGAQIVSGPSHRSVSTSTGDGSPRRSRSRQQSIDELPSIRIEPRSQTVRASRFTRSDLARITPFHYDGVVWCVRVPSGAFVARRNGKVFITGNSGFPKSLDVSKAIDAAAGAEREVIGPSLAARPNASSHNVVARGEFSGEAIVTIATTDAAKQWNGWGTALKPAHEPIVLARKPLIGTVAENVLKHGTGGLNIDGCRIEPTGERLGGGSELPQTFQKPDGWDRPWMHDPEHVAAHAAKVTANIEKASEFGRWPANVIHDGSEEVLAGFPETQSGDLTGQPRVENRIYGSAATTIGTPRYFTGDSGSAARFFYCAKSSQEDRNEGLDDLPLQSAGAVTDRKDGSAGLNSPRAGAGRTNGSRNPHPTVKPTDLMRYLCRLITPPKGLVLDPFCGSGSTGKAARAEGFRFIGIEISEQYCALAAARCEISQRSLFGE